MSYRIVNKTREVVLSNQAKKADNFFKRFLGLMFRKHMDEDEALIFYHSPSIHTFFMKMAIDVIFLDKNMQVVRIVENLRPGKVISCFKSFVTIELPAHKTSKIPLEIGDILQIIAS